MGKPVTEEEKIVITVSFKWVEGGGLLGKSCKIGGGGGKDSRNEPYHPCKRGGIENSTSMTGETRQMGRTEPASKKWWRNGNTDKKLGNHFWGGV